MIGDGALHSLDDEIDPLLNLRKLFGGSHILALFGIFRLRPGTVGCVFGLQRLVKSNRMTKQQLIEKVTAKTGLGKAEVEGTVDSVLEIIAETLRSNERVDLRGFGSFVVKDKKERQGRNPRTGETITIAAKRDATFRPGKELTEKLAEGETTPTTPEEAV
jgi:DNA-binding protein HU-beta